MVEVFQLESYALCFEKPKSCFNSSQCSKIPAMWRLGQGREYDQYQAGAIYMQTLPMRCLIIRNGRGGWIQKSGQILKQLCENNKRKDLIFPESSTCSIQEIKEVASRFGFVPNISSNCRFFFISLFSATFTRRWILQLFTNILDITKNFLMAFNTLFYMLHKVMAFSALHFHINS